MYIERREVTWYDILNAAGIGVISGPVSFGSNVSIAGTLNVSGAVTFASSLTVSGAVTVNNTVNISASTPTLTLTYPGTNTVSIELTSSANKIVTSWGPYLSMQSTGNYIVPVFEAKYSVTGTTALTATATLDQTYVLASSLPPNVQLILFVTATVYNNGGYTTSISAVFSNATVTLTTTSTSAVTLTGSATVTTLANGWLTLSLSALGGGTAYLSNVAAVLIPVAT